MQPCEGKRSYSNLTCLHPLNSTASKPPTPSSLLCLVSFLFLTDWFKVWWQKWLQEWGGEPVHFIISVPLLLLALFHIMKEECRHLRLKPLPFCVWSSLSSLCLNCQWAQLGLYFQYPFSTLHVIRKENQEWQAHLLPRRVPLEWRELEVKEVVTETIVPPFHATLAVPFCLAAYPKAALNLPICFLCNCDPPRSCFLFVQVCKAASPCRSQSQNQVLGLWYPSRRALEV